MTLQLLRELIAQAAGRRVRISVVDDASWCDYGVVRQFVERNADRITYVHHEANRGRNGLYLTYNEAMIAARDGGFEYLATIQDHSFPAPDFFDRIASVWKALPDRAKALVNLPRSASMVVRVKPGFFTGSIRCGREEAVSVGWPDGSWIAPGDLLDRLSAPLAAPDPSVEVRWHPVLDQFARKIREKGGNLYSMVNPPLEPAVLPVDEGDRRVHVSINHYNRPENVALLLDQLEKESAGYGLSVDIFDDASTADCTAILKRVEASGGGIRWRPAAKNLGKKGFWRTYNNVFRVLAEAEEDYHLIIQDDQELCDRFFDVLFEYWRAIEDPRMIALNFQRDTRGDNHMWNRGPVPLMKFGDKRVFFSGWVDGMWFGTRATLEALSYCIHPIDPHRWDEYPLLSSGVGHQVSERLHTAGYTMYMTHESLVRMISCESTMNPGERARTEIREVNFRDHGS